MIKSLTVPVYCQSARFESFKLPSAPALKSKPTIERRLFSDLVTDVKNNTVTDILVKPDKNQAYFINEDGSYNFSYYESSNEFWKILLSNDINIGVEYEHPNLIASLIPSIFMIIILSSLVRSLFSRGGPPNFTMKKSLEVQHNIDTRFEDVQGIDDAREELEEMVDFLREPSKYSKSGAKIPKGALLIGNPGTGKTLLARAIAGESSVPFIQVSASSFVEMFVGLGAKRVRDIFEEAKKIEPCIIFIDEIDAIGKKRSTNGFAGNDEREQTINQLLTEMDGFSKSQIVVIAATNRVDILDEALLRPGRFDRKIQVKLPDINGRHKILKVHAKDKQFANDVSLKQIAKQTIGFSGADLENILNECAIRSAKTNDEGVITNQIVEDTYQRIVIGAKGNAIMSYDTKKKVAYHEAGHALIGALMPSYEKVRKVSIVPRGNAGGITFFQPDSDEMTMHTKEYMLSQIKVALGGHAAEEVIFKKENVSTGASSDLMRVYDIAREMVTCYGFGNSIGKISVKNQKVSEETLRSIENEIKYIVSFCYDETICLLKKYIKSLDMLAYTLLEEEIVDGEYVYSLIKE